MNFIEEFKYGQKGGNKGLSLGPGLENLSKAIGGLQRKMMIAIASAPKTGKSTLVDYGFIIHPWLSTLVPGSEAVDLRFIYYSFEMDRITKEFDFAAHFMFIDYNIYQVQLPMGVTHNGNNHVLMSSDYLRGRLQDDNGEIIKIDPMILEYLISIYERRIKVLFGEFDENGKQLTPGVIIFEENIENPTGLYNQMLDFAERRGTFTYRTYTDSSGNARKRREGYTPNNPKELIVVVYDTVRKLERERNFSTKETVDKMLEYSTIIKKMCGYSFIPIIHLNRDLGSVNNLAFMKDRVYPAPEMIKDTGNISEEANHVITLFNPNDDRFNLAQHFGLKIRDDMGNKLYPFLRTIHLVESRQVVYPQHFRVNMYGNTKNFEKF